MASFRLATYESPTGPRAGLIVEDQLYDAATLCGRADYDSVLSILQQWRASEPLLRQAAADAGKQQGKPLAGLRLLAPVLYPPAVYCAGANYADHVAAMEKKLGLPPGPDPRADGGRPFHFLKASRCCTGNDVAVRAPTAMLDWEGELVAVIGEQARNVSVDDALKHVAGYMVGNDLSARDLGLRRQYPTTSIFYHSFIDHKSFEDAAPVGPWIVPASEVADPAALTIRTEVNGELKQNSSTSKMIFSTQEQIAYLSTVITLYPGDLIFTGTPAGCGAESGVFLKPGDNVAISIEGLGTLTTRIA
jgi:2-keto-4-pentenoate hydratase/2-oxohepta-3-ene-1,7-dioic acid hydratase in catechol pathway